MTLENESMFPINPAGLEKVMKEIVEGKPEKKEEARLEDKVILPQIKYSSLKKEFDKKIKGYKEENENPIHTVIAAILGGGIGTPTVMMAYKQNPNLADMEYLKVYLAATIAITSVGIAYSHFRLNRKVKKYKQELLADQRYIVLRGNV
ncbi:MAG: hypothetical protein V1660_02595 [archaeon]